MMTAGRSPKPRREIILRIFPDRHVEVDPPDDSLADPPPAPNTPWLYLRDAARALRDCGSAPALYDGWRGESGRPKNEGMAYLRAPGRRTEFARTSILFSAFAAEAYVNAYLAEQLAGDFGEVERCSTIEKYLEHVPRTSTELRFTRGAQPGQGLALLFRARNALVHPKKGVPVNPPITPQLAASSIIAVASAGERLTSALGSPDLQALAIVRHVGLFTSWARRSASSLPELMDDRPEDLLKLAVNAELGPPLNRRMREHLSGSAVKDDPKAQRSAPPT
jgi:hypothetical protein